MNAQEARRIIVCQSTEMQGTYSVESEFSEIKTVKDEYILAKGYLAALEGPEVKMLLEALEGRYSDIWIKKTLEDFRKVVKP